MANLSKELMAQIASEILKEEVEAAIESKRAEIKKAVQAQLQNVTQSKEFKDALQEEVQSYIENYDFEDAVCDYFDSNEGQKKIQGLIKAMFRDQ